MKKIFAITLLATAAVLAGDKTPDQLVKELGDVEYQVREDATKALMALGEKAVPALEKALKSDDVEVRMRAGRALRAIRGNGSETKREPEAGLPEGDEPKTDGRPERGSPFQELKTNRSVTVRVENGTYVVTITERDADGKATTKTYSGTSLDEIKKEHPEVREALGNMRFGVMRDPFKDFDKFFEDGWGRRRDDDFWKRADEDLNKEIERLREWAQRLAQQQRHRQDFDARSEADAQMLGVRARRPEAVLDAQLELRGKGLVVEEVARDSLAARLGLERYDIVLELNGMPLRSLADVGPALRAREEKAPVTAKVMRRGRPLDLQSAG